MPIVDISSVLLEAGLSASATDEERALANTALVRAENAVKRYLHYDPLQRSRTEYYPQSDFTSSARSAIWESDGNQAFLRRLSEAVTDELQVQHIPIRSITTLHLDYDARNNTRDNAFADETLQVEGTDYWPNNGLVDSGGNDVCRDGIIRSVGRWPVEPGSVKLVYVAGYSLAELHGQDEVLDASSIVEAIVDEAVRRVRKALVWKKSAGVGFTAGPLSGEKLGDYSYTTDNAMASRMFGGLWELLPETVAKLESYVNYGWPLAS